MWVKYASPDLNRRMTRHCPAYRLMKHYLLFFIVGVMPLVVSSCVSRQVSPPTLTPSASHWYNSYPSSK